MSDDITYDEHVEIENQTMMAFIAPKRWRTQVMNERGQMITVEVVEARVFDDLAKRNEQTESDLSKAVDTIADLEQRLKN